MAQDNFTTGIARHIWDTKYRYREAGVIHDQTIEDTWQRIAHGLAAAEKDNHARWQQEFYDELKDFRFLPGGRIHAGIGTERRVTLFNCFVMGTIEDSMDGIFDALKQGAVTMQQGGGVGYDFSTLRPAGTPARASGSLASGPVSFMRIWDTMCSTLLSTGVRRGAMMATLRCDHPDIETFIDAKQDSKELRHFNLSVQVTDEFMQAVREGREWLLVFPQKHLGGDNDGSTETVMRDWPGENEPVACKILRHMDAQSLWLRLMRATYAYAEPGVLFIDRINQHNNLWYREQISASNPCGEIPLPPYGACDLGSINLTQFVQQPFTQQAQLDIQALEHTTSNAVRMLDNIIDISHFPLEAQALQARGSRRIGLGITGLADALIMLGITYGSEDSYHTAANIMKTMCYKAYRTSIALTKEKGVFPFFDKDKYLQGKFIQTLPDDIQSDIATHGIRNSHLTAIAPTGTISLLANNVSSGLEPVFDFHYTRRVLEADGHYGEYDLTDAALMQYRKMHGEEVSLPDEFIDARRLSPEAHLDMQAAIQPYVDNAISKTINIPEELPFTEFETVYQQAYDKGLKGCTTFRPNPVTGAILSPGGSFESGRHCCGIEREAD